MLLSFWPTWVASWSKGPGRGLPPSFALSPSPTWVLIWFNSLGALGAFRSVHTEHPLFRDWLELWGRLLDPPKHLLQIHSGLWFFTFWAVMTHDLRTEVCRHAKPFRELKIRFTKGLQLPVTAWHFLSVMLWVLLDMDTSVATRQWVFPPQSHLCPALQPCPLHSFSLLPSCSIKTSKERI